MFNKFLIYFKNEEESEELIKYAKNLQSARENIKISGIHIEDIDEEINYLMKEDIEEDRIISNKESKEIINKWHEIEHKHENKIAEKFNCEITTGNFYIEEGSPYKILEKELYKYDVLIMLNPNRVDYEFKQLLKINKPLMLIPKL